MYIALAPVFTTTHVKLKMWLGFEKISYDNKCSCVLYDWIWLRS